MTKFKPLVLALAATLAVGGCTTVGPDYQAPTLEAPSLVNIDSAAENQIQGPWWQSFGDASLEKLVTLTLNNNPSLAAAKANMQAAYALFSDLDNDGLPKGNAVAGYQAQDQWTPGYGSERINTHSVRGGLQLGWTLDLFGRIRRTAEAAAADAEAARFAWHDLQVTLVSRVAQTYAELRGLEARVEVAKENVETLKRTQGVIQARVDSGYSSELDLLRVKAQLKGVEATIPALEAQAERAKALLTALAGGDKLLSDWQWQGDKLPKLTRPLAFAEPVELLRRRADVQAAERRLAASTARVGVSEARLYPELSISGFLGFLAPNLSSVNAGTRAWQVAPSLSWPVFDMASVNAQIDVANARQKMALAQLQQKWLDVVAEARSALTDYAKIQQQSHLLSEQVQASEKALHLAQLKYDAGAIDLLDLLDSQRTALAARDNLVQATTRTFVALSKVYRAFGGAPNPSNKTAGADKVERHQAG